MGPLSADEMVSLRNVISRPHRLAVCPVEALGDFLKCGFPAGRSGISDRDNVVDLPRARARTVVAPGHPGLELMLDVTAKGINGAA